MNLTKLHDISYGMYIIGARDQERFVGCVVNTVVQITSENPTIAISMNKNNYTYHAIENSKKFSINILSEDTAPTLIGTFGFQSSKDVNKYEGVQYEVKNDLPVIKEKTTATLLCNVLKVVDMETHVIILGRLADIVDNEKLTPMTYSYYHRVVKGKAPKNAPTYQAEEIKEVSEKYVCKVCGYVYEGDITQESDDFACPICNVPKSNFTKQL